jgi:cytochrome c biogenesis protein
MAQQRHYHAGTVALAPDAALSGAERVLRDRRFRLTRENGTLAAEKGHLREGGSLVFHTAFLVLLVGISVGKLYGYSGQVALVEGDTFRDTRIEYDSIATGRYFPGHTGMTIALDDFDVSWYGNGIPRDFVSKVRLGDGRREVRAQAIRVNHPLRYGGVRAYQLSWGWAPVIRVAQRGRVLYDGPTVFLTQGGAWRGVIKTPSSRPLQMGLDMLFVPDPQVDAEGNPASGGPEPNDPLLVFQQYLGDLGLDVPQSVYALDPTRLAPGEVGAMRMGETRVLKHGIEVSFTGLKQYSVFQVSSNPGAPVLLIAGILILVGLIPALYSSRRRVWVRAAGSDGVARLEIAGQALQRKAAFEEEFRTLVRTIDRDLMSRIGHG